MNKIVYLLFITLSINSMAQALYPETQFTETEMTEELIKIFKSKNKVGHWPQLGPLNKWNIHLDTFTHEIMSSKVEHLCHITCSRMKYLYQEK